MMSMSTDKQIFKFLFVYLLVSLLLSLVISIRLFPIFRPLLDVKVLSILLYDAYYYIMPGMALVLLISLFKSHKSKERVKFWEFLLFIGFSVLLFWADVLPGIPSFFKYVFFHHRCSYYSFSTANFPNRGKNAK